jgi:hypothetical protein
MKSLSLLSPSGITLEVEKMWFPEDLSITLHHFLLLLYLLGYSIR